MIHHLFRGKQVSDQLDPPNARPDARVILGVKNDASVRFPLKGPLSIEPKKVMIGCDQDPTVGSRLGKLILVRSPDQSCLVDRHNIDSTKTQTTDNSFVDVFVT
jgi:hypothetical protein